MGNTYGVQSYAAEVSTSSNPSEETSVYRSVDSLKKLSNMPKGILSTWDVFKASVEKNGNSDFLGYRRKDASDNLGPYCWYSYQEAYEAALKVGSYLQEHDLCPVELFPDEKFAPAQKLRTMGLFITNRPEWFMTEFGCASQDICLVPLYETLGAASMDYIIDLTRMKTLLISTSTFDHALKAAKSSKSLCKFIVIDSLTPEQQSEAAAAGVAITKWEEIMKTPASTPPNPPTAIDSINTLCFTSGTTGMPKGVLLTHQNVVSCAHCTTSYGPLARGEELGIEATDIHISYLPLAHVFERLVCSIVYMVGGRVGCFSGNMLKLMDDVNALNPTVFVSVPRLFNRINDKITSGVDQKGIIAQSLFSWGLNSKIQKFHSTANTKSSIWDRVVFGRFKGLLGNQLRFMVSGGAPLDPAVHERIQACFCAPILQGYGMSETMGPAFLCSNEDTVLGHVGGVYPSVEFKLEAVHELGYSTDAEVPKGELLIRGNSITTGYFRNPEANDSHFKDGWLHTGDICALLPSNGIKIIDRKKNLFKLAQGEYVAPEKIENTCMNSPVVNQIFVHGDSTQSFLVAIIVVDPDATKMWAANNGNIPIPGDLNDICKNDELKNHVLRSLTEASNNAGLMGFEKVKNCFLTADEFTVDNDLLTPTSKLKRAVALSRFKDNIDEMYREGMVNF